MKHIYELKRIRDLGEPAAFISERICLQDARYSSEFAQNILRVRGEFYSRIPKGRNYWVKWLNEINADVESEDFNPLGNRGQFVAILQEGEAVDALDWSEANQGFWDDFRKQMQPSNEVERLGIEAIERRLEETP